MKSMEYLIQKYDTPETNGYSPFGFCYYDSRVAEAAEQEAEEDAVRQERNGRRRKREKK